MTRTNIAAFTAVKYEGYYPPYISINEVDGAVEITIRSPEKNGAVGAEAAITLSREEYQGLLMSLSAPRDAGRPVPKHGSGP